MEENRNNCLYSKREEYNNLMTANMGKRIDNYLFNYDDILGVGNFSKCYKGVHEKTKEQVAIKIVELNSLKSRKLEELLYQEIDVLKNMDNPYILKCHEVFTSNRNCYIITELCDGNLEELLKRKGQLSEHQARPIIADVFKGLLYMASKHIIHRDLKTANVLLKNNRVKIADFGFAKFSKEKFVDVNIGSPLYMSPEGLLQNTYGPKTDVWSFGVLIYELLHATAPLSICKTEAELKCTVLRQIGNMQMKDSISKELKQIIIRCMNVKEEARVSTQEMTRMPYMKCLLLETGTDKMRSPPKLAEMNSNRPKQHGPEQEKRRSSKRFETQMASTNPSLFSTLTSARSCEKRSEISSTGLTNLLSPDILKIRQSMNQMPENLFRKTNDDRNENSYTDKPENRLTVRRRDSVREEYKHDAGMGHRSNGLTCQSPSNADPIKRKVVYEAAQCKSPPVHPTGKQRGPEFEYFRQTSPDYFKKQSAKCALMDERGTLSQHEELCQETLIDNIYNLDSPSTCFGPILNASCLHFKEIINILHYCRMLYKFIALRFDSTLGCFLLKLLSELIEFIHQQKVKYDGENVHLREKKLKEVCDEYFKKYEVYVHSHLDYRVENVASLENSLQKCNELRISFERSKIKRQNADGLYIAALNKYMNKLKTCNESGDYSPFAEAKEIEEIILSQKDRPQQVVERRRMV